MKKEPIDQKPELKKVLTEEELQKEKLSFAQRFANYAKDGIMKSFHGMGQEYRESREMAKVFFRMLAKKLDLENREEPPNKQEVKEAIEQLKDIGRISVFTSISIFPGGGFSLIGLELLARKFGIKHFTFVPSAFRKRKKEDGEED